MHSPFQSATRAFLAPPDLQTPHLAEQSSDDTSSEDEDGNTLYNDHYFIMNHCFKVNYYPFRYLASAPLSSSEHESESLSPTVITSSSELAVSPPTFLDFDPTNMEPPTCIRPSTFVEGTTSLLLASHDEYASAATSSSRLPMENKA